MEERIFNLEAEQLSMNVELFFKFLNCYYLLQFSLFFASNIKITTNFVYRFITVNFSINVLEPKRLLWNWTTNTLLSLLSFTHINNQISYFASLSWCIAVPQCEKVGAFFHYTKANASVKQTREEAIHSGSTWTDWNCEKHKFR